MFNRVKRAAVYFVMCAAVLLVVGAPDVRGAQEEAPDVVVQVVPDSLTLLPNQEVTVTVVVRNRSEQALGNLRLSCRSDRAVDVPCDVPSMETLGPGAESAWNVPLGWGEQAPTAANVYFRVDYERLPQAPVDGETPTASGVVPRVIFATLTLNAPAVQPVTDVVAMQVRSTLTTLNEQRPGIVYVVLENKSIVPLTVASLDARGPAYVSFIVLDPEQAVSDFGDAEELMAKRLQRELVLKPREVRSIAVAVRASDVVQPGKSLLLFEADVRWQAEGRTQSGTLTASHEVDVGIFGESQLLAILGVPAFFLLPGFLMLITFRFFWTWLPLTKERPFFIETPSVRNAAADYLLVSITLSLVMASLYPRISSLFWEVRRDYLQAYGLVDIYRVWFLSVGVGVAAYLIFVAVILGLRYQAQREEQRLQQEALLRQPAATDDAAETVRKLLRRNLDLQRPVMLLTGNGTRRVYWLSNVSAGEDMPEAVWVAPRILIRNRQALRAEDLEVLDQVLNDEQRIEALGALLPRVDLGWEEGWPHAGPLEAAQEEVELQGEVEMMVDYL